MADDLVSRRRAMLSAALRVIDELPEDDLLLAVTPERVGAHLGYSASSVRYQFAQLFGPGADADHAGPTKWSFDRARLLEAIVEEIEVRVLETTVAVRDGYLAALARAEEERSLAPLLDAVVADLSAYSPGATDEPANLSERSYLLAVTACDRSTTLGRRLRAIREQELDLYAPLFEAGLRASGRRLRRGVQVRGIADASAQLAEGASLLRRYRAPSRRDDLVTAQGMLGVFIGMTELDPELPDAPLRGLV